MQNRVRGYLSPSLNQSYRDTLEDKTPSSTLGWGPTARIDYINACDCDLALTLHENAGGGKGGMTLVSHKGGPATPPAQPVRLAKTSLQSMDAFGHGRRPG